MHAYEPEEDVAVEGECAHDETHAHYGGPEENGSAEIASRKTRCEKPTFQKRSFIDEAFLLARTQRLLKTEAGEAPQSVENDGDDVEEQPILRRREPRPLFNFSRRPSLDD